MLVPVSDAVTLGETAADPGDEAGALGELAELADTVGVLVALAAEEAAELVDELQAVTSKATPASAIQIATCLVLRESEVHMDSHPFNILSNVKPCHLYDARRATSVGTSLMEGCHHGPFGINITVGAACGGSGAKRTRVIA